MEAIRRVRRPVSNLAKKLFGQGRDRALGEISGLGIRVKSEVIYQQQKSQRRGQVRKGGRRIYELTFGHKDFGSPQGYTDKEIHKTVGNMCLELISI